LRRAAELAPEDDAVWQQLAKAHGQAEDWAAAVPCCERRVAKKPLDADAHNELGWAYHGEGRHAEAEASYRRALELQPDHLDAWLNLGLLHEELGAMAEAEACYREAETRHPRAPLPLAQRAVLVRGRLPEADRDRLRFEMYRPTAPLVRLNLLFALAHVADARGEHAEAAACLEPANAMARDLRRSRNQTYDPDQHTRYVDRLIAAFTPELFERLAGAGDQTTRPVFVFGLPRSGTTLVEQVLASHSQVFGAGELPLAHQALNALPATVERPEDMTACLEALDAAALAKRARGYQDGIEALLRRETGATRNPGRETAGGPAAPPHSNEKVISHADMRDSELDAPARVVDKMPDNYLYLGLLALLFPRATFIHVSRDVRDVAVSCWMTHFRSIRWADAQGDLARRIQDYRRLMEHWRRVVPSSGESRVPLHEVGYERLVEDFETEARRLVAACGLEWEPTCLRFHETSRPVRTASVTQVRQPLYRGSVARWRAYEHYLSDLFDRLNDTP
jgi:tetratricopeptide (TPR) repeat protein